MLFGRFYPPSHIDSCTIPPAVRLAESPPLSSAASSSPSFRSCRPCRGPAREAVPHTALRYACTVLLKSHPSGVSATKSILTVIRLGTEVTSRLAIFAVKKIHDLPSTFYFLPLTFFQLLCTMRTLAFQEGELGSFATALPTPSSISSQCSVLTYRAIQSRARRVRRPKVASQLASDGASPYGWRSGWRQSWRC